jgi:hypothetical protein
MFKILSKIDKKLFEKYSAKKCGFKNSKEEKYISDLSSFK